jgi:OOP family OmpA-OmpF porin
VPHHVPSLKLPPRAAAAALVAGAAAFALLTLSRPASAQVAATTPTGPTAVPGFTADAWNPSERGSEWFVLDSLDLRGDARGAIGVVGEYAYKPLLVYGADGAERAAVVRHQLVVHPGASLLVLDRLRLAVDVPLAVYSEGANASIGAYALTAPSGPAVGDVRAAADVRLFGRFGEPVTASLGLQVFAPTGAREQLMGDGTARFLPRLQVAGEAGPFVYAARGGVLLRVDDDPILGQKRGTGVVFGASAGVRLARGKLLLGPEVYGSASLTRSDAASVPVEGLLGAHYTIGRVLRVGGGVGAGLATGMGAPLVRGVLSIELAPDVPPPPPPPQAKVVDMDGDGILDRDDACPEEPGVRTADEATNGCPRAEDADADGDGVPDLNDACPEEPGVHSAEPRQNGCPPDKDGDGVPDKVDACPDRPGVEQKDPAQNGCPPDSDRDGVLDEEDACPDQPGVRSDDPKANGCPSPDRDGDGVLNEADACPDEAGPKDADPGKNGCPKAFVRNGQIRITDQVKFRTGSAEILPGRESESILEAVARIMTDKPEVHAVVVEGHTDNRGAPAANKKLSEQRAASVVKWLVAHGVDRARLSSAGYGQDRPVDTNATEAGRKNNRRVEFHIAPDAGDPNGSKEK